MAVTRLIFIYFSFTEEFSQVPFVHIEIKKKKMKIQLPNCIIKERSMAF